MATLRQSTQERRQQIVEASLRIISTQGVHRLTSAEIAREVGIADGTIFRHFHNKEEIIDAAIDYLDNLLQGDVPAEGLPPLDRLRAFFLQRLERVRLNPAVVTLVFSDRLSEAAGEAGASRVQQLVQRSWGLVRQCLAEAQARGELASDVPLEVLQWMVLGVLQRAAWLASGVAARPDGQALESAAVQDQPLNRHAPDAIWASLEKVLRRSAVPPALR